MKLRAIRADDKVKDGTLIAACFHSFFLGSIKTRGVVGHYVLCVNCVYPAHCGGRGGESERERGAGGLSCQRDEIARSYGGTTERAARPGNNSKQRRRIFFMQFNRINVI